MEGDREFRLAKAYLDEVIKPLLPCADYLDHGFCTTVNRPADFFDGKLKWANIFKESPYAYPGEYRFIHFTSKEGLLGIIESGYIRTTAIGNLAPGHSEFDGLKCFTAYNNSHNQVRSKTETLQDVFTLSMCESTIEMQNSEWMWTKYGQQHEGAFLEFSMAQEETFRHVVGKVIYDDNHHHLQQLNDRIIDFERAHKFDTNNYPSLFAELLAFHKPSSFSIENEVRWYYRQNSRLKHKLIVGEHTTLENQKRTHSRIFLRNVNNEIPGITPTSISEETIPSIYLHRVVLGCKNTTEQEAEIREALQNKMNESGYRFEVVRRRSD